MNKKTLSIVIAVILIAAVVLITRNQGEPEAVDGLLAPTVAADLYEEGNRLEVNEGSATVIKASGEEMEITLETEVGVGDTIRVSTEGRATLYWFDNSVSRLAGGTELVIDEAAYNPENINETDIGFEVVSGEVWSKVQAIVDEDSEFLGHSGNVVAGVRGSVFNMIVDEEEVEIDSIAHAITVGDNTVTGGEGGTFDKETGENLGIEDLSEEKLNRDWFKTNMEEDSKVAQRIMKAQLERLHRAIGALPGDPEFDVKLAELEAHLATVEDPAEKRALKAKIVALVRALDVLPDDQAYEIKEMLREKLIMWEDSDVRKRFLRKQRLERKLYELFDWAHRGELNEDQVRRFLNRFRNEVGDKYEFFQNNPELIKLLEKLTAKMEADGIDLEEFPFLKRIDELNDPDEPEVKPPVVRQPAVIRQTPPPPTTEPRSTVIEEAPFHQGESPL